MNLGKIIGEPNEVYHEQDAVSSSKLGDFERAPLLYYQKHVARTAPPEEAKEESSSTRVGSAFHALVLEGRAVFAERFVINKKFDSFRTNEAKAWRDEHLAAGKKILSIEEWDNVRWMQDSVLSNPDAAILVTDGEAEVTFRMKLANFFVQVRPDRWHEKGVTLPSEGVASRPTIVDVKTTMGISEHCGWSSFVSSFQGFGYYRQAALYREVVGEMTGAEVLPRHLFVAVENAFPFQTQVFEADHASQEVARAEIKSILRALRRCYETNIWPGVPAGVTPISLKPWFVRERARLLELGERQHQLQIT